MMVILARQHQPGHWKSEGENEYTPTKPWPETCYVQWGASGVVFASPKNYRTAFFEAFPPDGNNASSFIRGEGETIADAEAHAFALYEREINCEHRYGRFNYRNGAGFCRKCKAFRSGAFPSLADIGKWNKPLSRDEVSFLDVWPGDGGGKGEYARRLRIRRKHFGDSPT